MGMHCYQRCVHPYQRCGPQGWNIFLRRYTASRFAGISWSNTEECWPLLSTEAGHRWNRHLWIVHTSSEFGLWWFVVESRNWLNVFSMYVCVCVCRAVISCCKWWCKLMRWFILSVDHTRCSLFTSVLWHCWLGDRKGIRPVENWLMICWWWRSDWSFARLIAPVVNTHHRPPSSWAPTKPASPCSSGIMAVEMARDHTWLMVSKVYNEKSAQRRH